MTDLTPPPELAEKLWSVLRSQTLLSDAETAWNSVITLAHAAGADAELEACCALMDDWGLDAADLRAARRPVQPTPAPAPTADSPVATDEELTATASHALDRYKYASEMPYFLAPDATEHEPLLLMLRAVYNLGREHGANSKPIPNPSQIRSSDPAPTADKSKLLQEVIDDHLLRFRDNWNPTHAAVERWLIQQQLIAEGKAGSEEHDLLMTLDHPDWQPDAVEGNPEPTADQDCDLWQNMRHAALAAKPVGSQLHPAVYAGGGGDGAE